MNLKKILAVIFIVIAIADMILLALGKIPNLYFWIIIIICGLFAYFIMPRIK